MGDYSFKRDGVYAKCSIDMRPDRFVIESAGARFELPKSKVTGIEKMTRTQLEQAVKPNAGMAVLGGLGFASDGGAFSCFGGVRYGKPARLGRDYQNSGIVRLG